MRILTICEWGAVRSVACEHALKEMGHDAMAVGWHTTSRHILQCLCRWSEAICVMEGWMIEYVPDEFRDKVRVIDVGPDHWHNPFDQELRAIINSDLRGGLYELPTATSSIRVSDK